MRNAQSPIMRALEAAERRRPGAFDRLCNFAVAILAGAIIMAAVIVHFLGTVPQ